MPLRATTSAEQLERLAPDEWHLLAAQLLAAGRRPDEVRDALVARGLSREGAKQVTLASSALLENVRGRAGRRNMLFGLVWFAVGLGLSLAGTGKGSVRIFYGAMAAGVVQFGIGVSQWVKDRLGVPGD